MTVVKHWIPSPHHSSRVSHVVDLLVLHFSAGNGDAVSLGRYFQRQTVLGANGKVRALRSSAHYGVSRDGTVAQYVGEDRAAWHAGDGLFPERDELLQPVDTVNRRSIGIEICNRGWAPGKRPRTPAKHRNPRSTSTTWEVYPPEQIAGLAALIRELVQRNPSLKYVTGHEDVTNYVTAGGSKLDPGPLFPWEVPVAEGLTRVMFDFNTERFVVA